ncbi:unnamed protein product [Fraxinus pennsylvanica]|uniref:Dynein light chain n=1 Tax=Fraxinus pennsylvanica TaxID=56036 RepID=A0AAD1YUR1_9LAMI|nr:unnamed protein product [Fraxinus pennsylvanica]
MDPTQKKQLKSTPSTTTTKPHPFPDPTTTTIQKNMSHHFSKPCANHKKLASLIPSSGHSKKSQHDTNFQAKCISVPSVLDTSCTTLTKSKSQNERNNVFEEFNTRTKVKEKFKNISEIKKPSKKDVPKKSCCESQLKPTSLLESEKIMKRFQQGFEMRRSSIYSLPMNGGTRRSFCSSPVELADFLSCNGVKVVAVDMPPFMQIHAVDCARKTHDSLEKFTSKALALALKKEFDGVYGPAWHCIVGTGFGSFVTHSVGGFIYFSMDHKLYVLLFKTTVQRAD